MCINKPGNTFYSEYQKLSDDRLVSITRLGKRKIITSLQHIQTNYYHMIVNMYKLHDADTTTAPASDSALALVFQEAIKKILIVCA
jgi:hypothetical protein